LKPILWEDNRRIPAGVRAALAALRFTHPDRRGLRVLCEREWEETLRFCDRSQTTLFLWERCGEEFPGWVRERVGRNLADNTDRNARIREDVFKICCALEGSQTEYVMLKGLTQWPRYVADSRLRVQYDLDLYCPPDSLYRARDVLLELGYGPAEGFENFPIDHLPTMVRKTGFEWRGNYFDPDVPVCVDVHFRFWDEETERFAAAGLDEFWERRTKHPVDGRCVPALDPADGLAYTSLHLLRHLLRGSLRLCHAYELACFLETNRDDGAFWEKWRGLHPPGLRRLEAIAFRLAAEWFDCRTHETAKAEIVEIPKSVQFWFESYAASPMEGYFRPNKDEVWLHLCLLDAGKWSVLKRRLLPSRLPARAEPGNLPASEITPRLRWQARLRYAGHVAARAMHHAVAFTPALWKGTRWWLEAAGPETAYWRYLLTASLYHLGVFVFVLLYNLYLLDRGFREDFLGLIASAATIGSLAGSLPAAWGIQRFGLRKTVVACIVGTVVVSAARSLVSGPVALVATALLGGALSSVWFVSVAPAVSGLSSERNRPTGFSLFFATGIAVGVLGGLAGGRLPGWIQEMFALGTAASAKQAALLAGCAISALAILPARHLSLPAGVARESRVYPWNPVLARFFAAIAAWSFATGCLSPFFTALFSRHFNMSDERIGLVFSGSQLAQVAAVLAAPLVLRRFGLVGGVVAMQVAAAAMLATLASGPPILAAATAYVGFMSLQSMCEPGTYSLLMNHVGEEQRSGASALNFLVIFSAQAAAAGLAGIVITRLGYPAMLAVAATVALGAAFLFRRLLQAFDSRK
jgi:MFS family permease